jgi:angio-associated migratory cell protein
MDDNNYSLEGEELIEVEVDDYPPESETESLFEEMDKDDTGMIDEDDQIDEDGSIEEKKDPAIDMSLATFTGHEKESVYCVAIHPINPQLILTGGGDDCAYLWSYDFNGQSTCLFSLRGHNDSITSVGFNFDGSLALTGSYDGTVRIWNAADGQLKQTLDGPEDIDWAEWHSKGNAVIAGSKDGTVWMWLAHNGQCVQVFAGHDGGVSAGCFTKDGKLICTGGEDGSVRVWAPKTGLCKITFDGLHLGHEGTVTCLENSNDGDMLLSGSIDGKVRLYQLSGKKLMQTFIHCSPQQLQSDRVSEPISKPELAEEDVEDMEVDVEATLSVECVGFYQGGDFKWIASGGMDSYLKVWDMVSGTCRSLCKHNGSVVALRWHASLPIIATASLDQNLRLVDARNGLIIAQLSGHNDSILSLALSPLKQDDQQQYSDVIVTVSDDATAKVFPINTKTLFIR